MGSLSIGVDLVPNGLKGDKMAKIKMCKIGEVAKQLSVTERTVYSWVKDKKIIANKIGNKWQFTQEEVDYIKKNGLRG